MSKIDDLLVLTHPTTEMLPKYVKWLKGQTDSDNTVKVYLNALTQLSEVVDLEEYFANRGTKGKYMKISAYRSWLEFCRIKLDLLDNAQLVDLRKLFKLPKKNSQQAVNKCAYPQTEWNKIMAKGINESARMGMWIGFNFGLRLGEIVNLEVSDIDFDNQEILIRPKDNWSPKRDKSRQIQFSHKKALVFKSWIKHRSEWINNQTAKGLAHNYLLFTNRGNPVSRRNFQRYMQAASITTHELRYSFATHFYQQTKDIELIGDQLGHENIETTSRYLKTGKETMRDKARAMHD